MKPPNTRLVLAGDWNEGPESTGRYSPAWVARKSGLTIAAAAPGKRGRVGIDYVMSSVPVEDVVRLKEDISDHNPVAFTVFHKELGRALRLCTFNVMRDRTQLQRRALVEWLAVTGVNQGIAAYALQEIRQYHDLLETVPGYDLYASTDPDGVEHNGLLVRQDVPVRADEFRLTSKVGWVTVTGANHDPSSIALATIDGWCRLGSVHEAPTVDWVNGKPIGPAKRVAVRVASARTLVQIGQYWKVTEEPPPPPDPIFHECPDPACFNVHQVQPVADPA